MKVLDVLGLWILILCPNMLQVQIFGRLVLRVSAPSSRENFTVVSWTLGSRAPKRKVIFQPQVFQVPTCWIPGSSQKQRFLRLYLMTLGDLPFSWGPPVVGQGGGSRKKCEDCSTQDLPRCARNTSSWPSLQVGVPLCGPVKTALNFQPCMVGFNDFNVWPDGFFPFFAVIFLHLSPRWFNSRLDALWRHVCLAWCPCWMISLNVSLSLTFGISLFLSLSHSYIWPWFGVYVGSSHTRSCNDSNKNRLKTATCGGCLTPSYEPLIPGMPSRPARLIDP